MLNNGTIITENQTWYDCWIDNLVTGEHIVLPQTPVGFNESYAASYANQDIIGSSRPRVMYTGTSLRTISFSLQNLSRDYLPAGYKDLKDYIHKLQALCFPEYSASGIITAPNCHLQIGDRAFEGVFTSVNAVWGDEVYNGSNISVNPNDIVNSTRMQGGYEINGGERIRCNVELSFTNTRLRGDIPGATHISKYG